MKRGVVHMVYDVTTLKRGLTKNVMTSLMTYRVSEASVTYEISSTLNEASRNKRLTIQALCIETSDVNETFIGD